MTNFGNQPFQPPAFIVGKERSGTTLLSAILNRHPMICVTPETDFLYQLSSYPGGDAGFIKNWPKSLFAIIDRMESTEHWNKPAKHVYAHLKGKPVSGKEAFMALGEIICYRYEKSLWIEKTPNHILCLPFIRQLFPNAPIIHIVRDGRDVSHSLTKVNFGSPNFFENLWLWIDAIRKFESFSNVDSNNLTIRYEDLIQYPEKTIRIVCDYLKIEFYPHILNPDGSEAALIVRTGNHMNQVADPIDKRKLANWQKVLSPELQNTSLMIAHKELIQHGYEKAPSDNPKVLCLSEAILLSHYHRQLYDLILNTVANSNTSYRLESVTTLNASLPEKLPSLWITDEMPLPKPDQRKNFIVFFLNLLRIFKNIIRLKIAGVKLVWVLHADIEASQNWLTRRLSELFMAKIATIVLPVADNKCDIDKIKCFYRLNTNKCIFSDAPDLSYKLANVIK